MNDYKIIDNELNRSFNTVKDKKLSSNMNIKSQRKMINSHNAAQLEEYKLNFEGSDKLTRNKESIKINTDSENKGLLKEKEVFKNGLNENLDYDNKYLEIETELNIIRDIQNMDDNFQNEQTCKYLFLNYKYVEFSLALFTLLGIFI